MPTTRRARSLSASPDEVWAVVGDPHHLPRWWPRVTRVESVDEAGFTEVLTTSKGKSVRADFRVLESVAPEVRRWTQELLNTPFERILARADTVIRLAPQDGGTRVTLTVEQQLRGLARFGGYMVRGATRKQLDEALDGLQALVGP